MTEAIYPVKSITANITSPHKGIPTHFSTSCNNMRVINEIIKKFSAIDYFIHFFQPHIISMKKSFIN